MRRFKQAAQALNSIRNKSFFSILLFLIIPFLLTFYWVDKPLESVIEQKIGDSTREALHQVKFNTELFLEDMLRSAVEISTNPSITDLLTHPERFTDYEKLRLKDNVINKQYSSYYTETYVTLMDLYGNWHSTRYMDEGLYQQYTQSAWYKDMVQKPFQLRWMLVKDHYVYSDKRPLITLVKTITDLQTNRNIGMLLFGVAEKDLRKYLGMLEGEVYLVDGEGTVLSSPDSEKIGTSIGKEAFAAELGKAAGGQSIVVKDRVKWIVNYDTVGQTGWKIVQLIPYDTVFKEIFGIRRANILIVLGIFIVFMFITLSIALSISRPLQLLNKKMREVEERDFNSTLQVSGPSEISTLIGTYNKMLKQIRDLLQRVKEEYQQKEDMRFRALQAQINPHFILNTLNNIKWMAYIRGVKEVGDMLSSLGGILEGSIGRGGNLISLRQELQYIENYINLMKLKYNDKLTVHIDVPDTCLEQEVIKFLLQPVVENAIQHGIEPLPGKGEIRIEAEAAEALLILRVRDNGVGIPEAKLAEIRQRLETETGEPPSQHIGLKNVHERIRYHYGEAYGLTVDSRPGEGTEVRLALPLITYRKEESHETQNHAGR